ncbi:MAG: ankyrin repeat domain-containing protein [Rhodospirillaceae bacterium]|nr:ankyrin repeat domain-containing protein [Rhodospirillaceae bacterium]
MARRASMHWRGGRGGAPGLVLVGLLVLAGAEARAATPLVDAARSADGEALRALIDQGAGVDAAEADGTTALHWASYHDDVASADALIRAGAPVDAANDLGATPLWSASLNAGAAMVDRLLDAGADPNAALLSGETPLMVAARAGSTEVVERLLAGGAESGARGARGQTALMWAVAQHHADVVAVLLDHGADLHARSDVWSQVMAVPPHSQPEYNRAVPHGGNSALMFAARVGDLASATLLLAAGADANDTSAGGVSATALAAHAGYPALVELLLERGADPNAAAGGFTALHAAVMRRDATMARTLLAHGADPNLAVQTWTPTRRASRDFHFPPALVGATPFWLAARFADPVLMRLLSEHGADPLSVHRADYKTTRLQRRQESTTALMAAVGMGGGGARGWIEPAPAGLGALRLEAVATAAALGVDLNAVDTDGRTALDAARALGDDAVVAFLVERGARSGSR